MTNKLSICGNTDDVECIMTLVPAHLYDQRQKTQKNEAVKPCTATKCDAFMQLCAQVVHARRQNEANMT